MKLSVEISGLELASGRAFDPPKGFRFVYHSPNRYSSFYYRWPLNYLVSLYIKVYYWFMKHVYVKLKRPSFPGRKQKAL